MSAAPTRVPALDGLRGIAVTLVALLHFGYLNGGWIGVQAFFVLSGFLITGVLLADRDAPLGTYLRRFYWRRTLRIFPLYYGYLAILGVAYLVWRVPADFGDDALPLVTYTYNFTRATDFSPSPFFTHLWSLAVEEQFYLVWPFLVHALSRRALVAVACVLVAVGPVFRWALALWLDGGARDVFDVADTVYWFPLSHGDAFASGALVALLRLGDRVTRPFLVAAAAVAVIVTAGYVNLRLLRAAGVELPLWTMGFPLATLENAGHLWSYTLLNFASAALVAAAVAAHQRGGVVRALGWAPLAGLGTISYGVYVLHWPMLVFYNAALRYRPMTLRGGLHCAAWYALVIAVAWLSFRFYERRFLALKDRVAP